MSAPCVIEDGILLPLVLDVNGSWQLARHHAQGFPLDSPFGGFTCDRHGDRIPPKKKCVLADRDITIPPLPTLEQLHDLIAETLRQQGFARAQAVIDGRSEAL